MPKYLIAASTTDHGMRGFSLMEMVTSLAILIIVVGVAVAGMVQMQHRNSAESNKVDTVQETRDFIDQMVRDIHDIGYPPSQAINSNPSCVNNPNVACGLMYFSSTQLQYEGDLDGTGTVYEVFMQLVVPQSGACPCTLQRGVITKAAYLNGAVPTYFTEVNGVLNSGNGAGGTTYGLNLPGPGSYTSYGTADVFDSYDVNGALNPVGTCNSQASCSSIRNLQITVNVAPHYADMRTEVYSVFSITSKARLNNCAACGA